MDQVTLSAQRRTESGTRPAKRMRREGLVPAVVYGAGLDTLHVAVKDRELYSALHTDAGANAIFNVEIEGGTQVLAVAREVQRHPVRGEITHLDFIQVRLDVEIEAEVGVEFVGEPQVVAQEGAIIETVSNSVMISALPTGIPSSIPVEIQHLELGDTLTVSDLPEVEGVTYLDEPDSPLLTVLMPRLEEPEPATLTAVEGELGADGEIVAEGAEAGDGNDEG